MEIVWHCKYIANHADKESHGRNCYHLMKTITLEGLLNISRNISRKLKQVGVSSWPVVSTCLAETVQETVQESSFIVQEQGSRTALKVFKNNSSTF